MDKSLVRRVVQALEESSIRTGIERILFVPRRQQTLSSGLFSSSVHSEYYRWYRSNGTISVKEVQLSLTDHWVLGTSRNEKSHPHRLEIEAAPIANLENPFFDQVVVILEYASEEAQCSHFLRRMYYL
jgi:hypothetical protein